MSAPAYSLDKDFKYTLAEQMRAANAASVRSLSHAPLPPPSSPSSWLSLTLLSCGFVHCLCRRRPLQPWVVCKARSRTSALC